MHREFFLVRFPITSQSLDIPRIFTLTFHRVSGFEFIGSGDDWFSELRVRLSLRMVLASELENSIHLIVPHPRTDFSWIRRLLVWKFVICNTNRKGYISYTSNCWNEYRLLKYVLYQERSKRTKFPILQCNVNYENWKLLKEASSAKERWCF